MNIKETRKAAGLTQVEMSQMTYIPVRTIQNWENGVRTPSDWIEKLVVEKLESIADKREIIKNKFKKGDTNMKVVDIKSKLYEADNTTDKFLTRCVIPETYLENETKEFNSICEKAEDFEEFLNLYIESEMFKYSQGAYEIYRKFFPEKLWYKLREFLGKDCKKADSDIGSLKIGNDNFSFLIPNGHGDGVTRYAIFNSTPKWADFFGNINNNFIVNEDDAIFVYDYDCGDTKCESIPKGKYFSSSHDGLVLIYKYADID